MDNDIRHDVEDLEAEQERLMNEYRDLLRQAQDKMNEYVELTQQLAVRRAEEHLELTKKRVKS